MSNNLRTAVKNIIDNLQEGRFAILRTDPRENVSNNIAQSLALQLDRPTGLQTVLSVLIQNMTSGAMQVYILDDGTPRDVTAESIQNIRQYLADDLNTHPSERTARAMLKQRNIYQLVLDFEESEKTQMTDALPIVRQWLMEELEERNPAAFNEWMESLEVSPRKFFVV